MTNWLLTDLHIHTKFSDGTMELSDVIDFYGKLNFDAIAITDHQLDVVSQNLPKPILPYNWIKNENEFKIYYQKVIEEVDRARKLYDMIVIPGVEFTNYISNIHIVGLDIKKYIEVKVQMDETLIIAKSQNMLLVGAHPYDAKFYKLGGGLWRNKKVAKYIDVWEAGNGIEFFPHVVENGYKYIANTDFHGELHDHGIKGWKTLIKAEKNVNSIKQAIIDQKIALYKFR